VKLWYHWFVTIAGTALSNLTLSIDDQLIRKARVRVAQQGTSLSAKVRELLQAYVDGSDDTMKRQREEATALLMSAIEMAASQTQATAPIKDKVKTKTLREELYEDNFRQRDQAQTSQQANKTPSE
jgi:plasmid stability protein